MLAASELNPGAAVPEYLRRATVQTLRCDKDHTMTAVPKEILSIWLDDDWEEI
jgi:hypothetical protein